MLRRARRVLEGCEGRLPCAARRQSGNSGHGNGGYRRLPGREPVPVWFLLYWQSDRTFNGELLTRKAALGAKAISVTHRHANARRSPQAVPGRFQNSRLPRNAILQRPEHRRAQSWPCAAAGHADLGGNSMAAFLNNPTATLTDILDPDDAEQALQVLMLQSSLTTDRVISTPCRRPSTPRAPSPLRSAILSASIFSERSSESSPGDAPRCKWGRRAMRNGQVRLFCSSVRTTSLRQPQR